MTPFLSAFLPNLAATFLSIVAAWIIYYLGTYQKRKGKREFEKKRWEYFQYLLKNANERINSNLKLLESTINTLADYVFIIPHIEQKPNGDLRRLLHDIDLEGIFHLYTRLFPEDDKKKKFYEVISILDYFELNMDLLKVVFENAMRNDFGRRVDFNTSLIRAANRVDEIKQILLTSQKSEEYLQVIKIDDYYRSKEQENLQNYKYHFINLLLPIHEVLQRNISINPYFKGIIFDFESAIFKYNLIIKGNRSFQSELEEGKMQLASELEKLDKLIRPLLISNIKNNL